MDRLTEAVVTIGTAIIGVAILAVLVSKRSDTAHVLMASGQAFSGALGAATAPVTGASSGGNTGFGSGYGASFGGLNLNVPSGGWN